MDQTKGHKRSNGGTPSKGGGGGGGETAPGGDRFSDKTTALLDRATKAIKVAHKLGEDNVYGRKMQKTQVAKLVAQGSEIKKLKQEKKWSQDSALRKLEAQNKENVELKGKYEGVKRRLRDLEKQEKGQKKEIAESDARADALQNENNELGEKLRSSGEYSKMVLENVSGDLLAVSLECEEATSENKALKVQMKKMGAQIESLRGARKRSSRKYKKLVARHNALLDKLKALGGDYEELDAAYEALGGDYEELDAAYEALGGDYEELDAAYEALEGQNRDLMVENEDLSAALLEATEEEEEEEEETGSEEEEEEDEEEEEEEESEKTKWTKEKRNAMFDISKDLIKDKIDITSMTTEEVLKTFKAINHYREIKEKAVELGLQDDVARSVGCFSEEEIESQFDSSSLCYIYTRVDDLGPSQAMKLAELCRKHAKSDQRRVAVVKAFEGETKIKINKNDLGNKWGELQADYPPNNEATLPAGENDDHQE